MRTAQGAFAAFNKHWLGNNHKHFFRFTKRSRRIIRLQFIAPRGQGTLYGGARFGRQRDELASESRKTVFTNESEPFFC